MGVHPCLITMNESDDYSSNANQDSETDEFQNASPPPRSGLRPAGKAPVRLASSFETSDEDEPTIPYNVEWKLSINRRRRAGESETGITESPRSFWKRLLQPKLGEATAKKPCRVDDTDIVMTTTHRSTGPFRKRYSNLDIDWPVIERRLRDWNKLPNTGKKRNLVTITITFESTHVESSKPAKGSATVNQLEDLQARIGDGAVLSRGVCIRKAFALMRCPGPPCKNGSDHCWQFEGQHYPLHPHHVKMLADHLQSGRALNGHEDVPETFRRLVLEDERDRERRQDKERSTRKRRRQDSNNLTILPPNAYQTGPDSRPYVPVMVFPTTPLMGFDQCSEDLVRAYGAWLNHEASEEQKGHYEFIQQLILKHGFDLDFIGSNKEWTLFFLVEEEGVPRGFAWRYVCGVTWFMKLRQKARAN